jgi:hypothetical protein
VLTIKHPSVVAVNYEAHLLDDGKLVAKSDKVVEFTVKDG